jgi:hypothetical protein
MFKNTVRTSKKTPHFIIKKIKWLMPFKKLSLFTLRILPNPYTKNIELLIVKAYGLYSYRLALKG